MAGFCPFTRFDISVSSVRTPQTFLTLSLQDMASRVQLSGPQEAEKYVLHMVSCPERLKHKKHNPVDADGYHDSILIVVLQSLISVVLDRFGLEGLNGHITMIFALDFLHSACFLLCRLKMVRSMLALTKKMVWSASMTTLKNTTTQQCSTKLTKRCGGSDLCSLFLCFAWIHCSCNTQILHEF